MELCSYNYPLVWFMILLYYTAISYFSFKKLFGCFTNQSPSWWSWGSGWIFYRNQTRIPIDKSQLFSLTIANQRHGLETQAKFLILLTPHPWQDLKHFIFKPCNFTLTLFLKLINNSWPKTKKISSVDDVWKSEEEITKTKLNFTSIFSRNTG